jgi:hypothetical protein
MKELLEKVLTEKEARDAQSMEAFATAQDNFLSWQ